MNTLLFQHQPDGRVSAPPGPKESEVRSQYRAIALQGEREIHEICFCGYASLSNLPIPQVECRSYEQYLSRRILIEQLRGRCAVGFGQYPFRRIPPPLAASTNHVHAISEWRQRGCKPVQLLPQISQSPSPLRLGRLCLQSKDDLRVETPPLPFRLSLIAR